ncbi:type II toxin-antitoxin system RelE/ParE family toxin [Candidatus Poriferisodalis sp.]|uniref:type II toxin-antitoxin system RelE/ParE family toxin n=1 Tax=Candidatus Poriferisodalis sp. TaxID=3101277 RepID=UPI003B021FF0
MVERSGYCRSEGSEIDGLRFFDAAIGASRDVGRTPRAGTPRIEEMAGIDGLRSRRLGRLPCIWFRFERCDHVDVVRLLVYAQDLETTLGDLSQDR